MLKQTAIFTITFVLIILFTISCGKERKSEELLKLTVWDRGIKLQSRKDTTRFTYLWFYEWHMFDAVKKGEHTHGSCAWEWTTDDNHTLAQIDAQWLKMTIKATENWADMSLQITNTTDYYWSEIAAIIPCFNPGGPFGEVKLNPIFLDKKYENTYFIGPEGIELIKGQYPREIHFAHEYYLFKTYTI